MSVFSGLFDPVPWLREKTADALRCAVHLIDIANEPDTTPWYRKTLLRVAEQQLHALIPVVAFIHSADEDAADYDQWKQIIEGGSFALGGWCRKWKIANPPGMAGNAALEVMSNEEIDEKDQEPVSISSDVDPDDSIETKLEIYASMTRRLVHDELPPSSKTMLLWFLSHLRFSDIPDVITISRRFLPTDIGLTVDETHDAYRQLFEHGFIDSVGQNAEDANRDRLNIRLVVEALNEHKHHREFRDEIFGFPGARVAGKVTMGQVFQIELPETLTGKLGWWFKQDQAIPELRDALQSNLGAEILYVESAAIKIRNEKPTVAVSFRFPVDSERKPLEDHLSKLAEEWIHQKLELGHLGPE